MGVDHHLAGETKGGEAFFQSVSRIFDGILIISTNLKNSTRYITEELVNAMDETKPFKNEKQSMSLEEEIAPGPVMKARA